MSDVIVTITPEVSTVEVETAVERLITANDEPALVIETKDQSVIITEVETPVEIDTDDLTVVIETPAAQGPRGVSGSAAGGGVFILDLTTTSGIVGSKTYKPGNVPANAVLDTAISDTTSVRVWVGANGGAGKYSPDITVNDVPVTLTQSPTVRWFTGYADITLSEGQTLVRAKLADLEDTATITLAGPGPDVDLLAWGAYPGTQTALKAGDTITLIIATDTDAVAVDIAGGSTANSKTVPVSDGTATTTMTIGNGSDMGSVVVTARNALGTPGTPLTSPMLVLDQTYPSFGVASVAYPGTQTSLGAGDTATLTLQVNNADVVSYSGPGLTIDDPNTYALNKTVHHALAGETSGTVFINATRSNNAAHATTVKSIDIDTIAPTAAITIAGNPARLVSSPTGINYEVRITPSQNLLEAPTLNASIGAWQGEWTKQGAYWARQLNIADADPKGTGVFSALTMVGGSGIAGSVITSGEFYTVGGFTSRTLAFPAFSRVTALGTAVADANKLTAQIAGGSVLTLHTDNADTPGGFYPANVDGSYNDSGVFVGLSDLAFAGSNTSGTLQVIVAEAA